MQHCLFHDASLQGASLCHIHKGFPAWSYARAMSTYIILTKLAADAFRDPVEFPGIAKMVSEKIKADCPKVAWKESYAVTGAYDVLDVVDAPDLASVERVCMIIRAHGHGTTETLLATPWADFLKVLSPKKTTATVGTV